MSVYLQTIVDVEAGEAEAGTLAERVCERLRLERIITRDASTRASLPGGRPSDDVYRAGERARETSERAFRHELEIDWAVFRPEVGRRAFPYGEDGTDSEAHCPACGAECDIDEVLDAAISWDKSRSETSVLCAACGKRSEVTKMSIEPAWGFGFLAFTFEDWSPLQPAFVDRVAGYLGHRVVLVEWFL